MTCNNEGRRLCADVLLRWQRFFAALAVARDQRRRNRHNLQFVQDYLSGIGRMAHQGLHVEFERSQVDDEGAWGVGGRDAAQTAEQGSNVRGIDESATSFCC